MKTLVKAREDVLNSFKSNLFPIISDKTSYVTPRKTTINKDSFINEIINDQKGIKSEIFNEYFGYQNLSFFVEDLLKANQTKSNEIVSQTNDSINELKNAVNKKKFLKMEIQIK